MDNELGKLTLTFNEAALQKIIAEGRLLEFTNTISKLAAEQIPQQVVDHLAKAATGSSKSPGTGTAVDFAFVMEEGGSYGTKPHLPPRPTPWKPQN